MRDPHGKYFREKNELKTISHRQMKELRNQVRYNTNHSATRKAKSLAASIDGGNSTISKENASRVTAHFGQAYVIKCIKTQPDKAKTSSVPKSSIGASRKDSSQVVSTGATTTRAFGVNPSAVTFAETARSTRPDSIYEDD